MKKMLFSALWVGSLFFTPIHTSEPPLASSPTSDKKSTDKQEAVVLFTPPAGWQMADSSKLSSHVRFMVVGNGPSNFPPSINLSSEHYKGTLREYLKIVKNMNSAQGYEWKDLGNIRTEAGNANLSQVDTKTQWGEVRLMHVILIKNGNVYILTASALKNEFSIFYKDFFAAMRSLRVANDVYDMITNPQQRAQLKTAVDKLNSQWQTLLVQKQKDYPLKSWEEVLKDAFKSEEFQNTIWKPFKEMLNQKYGNLGTDWISFFEQEMEEHLLNTAQ